MKIATITILGMIFISCGDGDDSNFGTKNVDNELPDKFKKEYPKNFTWENVDDVNYVTSQKHQDFNDCYVYSVMGIAEMQYKIDHNFFNDLDLSENNYENCTGTITQQGGTLSSVLEYVKKYGILEQGYAMNKSYQCDNCNLKYDISYFSFLKYTWLDKSVVGASNYNYKKYLIVKNIQNGPISIGVTKWNLFLKDSDGVVKCNNEDNHGGFGHAMVIVGYEDYGNILILKDNFGGNELKRVQFDNAQHCGFAAELYQVSDTFKELNMGRSKCTEGK